MFLPNLRRDLQLIVFRYLILELCVQPQTFCVQPQLVSRAQNAPCLRCEDSSFDFSEFLTENTVYLSYKD